MELCDITLTVGNLTFSAHRLVLAGNSPYFRNLFKADNAMAESKDLLLLNDFQSEAVRSVLEYFYSGKLCVKLEDTEELLSLSCLLQVCIRYKQYLAIWSDKTS